MNMTDEEMRIAIAEACPSVFRFDQLNKQWLWNDGGAFRLCLKNDPLQDLNAMHEVEELLPEEKRPNYVNNLYLVAVEHQIKTGKWRYSGLSARQRAIALIKTLNLEPA